MTLIRSISHKFVEAIPGIVEDGTLYVSREYATAVHKCCCGCGAEIVTPLGPTDWQLTFDGRTVSLYPSVGNWSFACKSHYWIRHGSIIPAEQWSRARIDAGRRHDRLTKDTYFLGGESESTHAGPSDQRQSERNRVQGGILAWLLAKLLGK